MATDMFLHFTPQNGEPPYCSHREMGLAMCPVWRESRCDVHITFFAVANMQADRLTSCAFCCVILSVYSAIYLRLLSLFISSLVDCVTFYFSQFLVKHFGYCQLSLVYSTVG